MQDRETSIKTEKDRKEKDEKYQLSVRKYGDEMSRLRASLDNGASLNTEDERRLALWQETGKPIFTGNNESGVRDSMAMMLFQGTTR